MAVSGGSTTWQPRSPPSTVGDHCPGPEPAHVACPCTSHPQRLADLAVSGGVPGGVGQALGAGPEPGPQVAGVGGAPAWALPAYVPALIHLVLAVTHHHLVLITWPLLAPSKVGLISWPPVQSRKPRPGGILGLAQVSLG